MARQEGVIKIVGRFGDFSFYRMLGEYYIRRKGGGSRETIRTRESCEPTRQNNREFSGASAMGKSMRRACHGLLMDFGDSYLTGRLGGQLKRVCQLGEGAKGRRTISLCRHGHVLTGFEMNRDVPLNAVFDMRIGLDIRRESYRVMLGMRGFDAGVHVRPPARASHFRLLCLALCVPDYVWNDDIGSYAPLFADVDGLGASAYSEFYPVEGYVPDICLTMDFGKALSIVDRTAVVVCLGIEFCRCVNGVYGMVEKVKSMRVVEVCRQ